MKEEEMSYRTPIDLADLSLPALIARTWRIKAARMLYRAANAIMALAERVLPEDLRRW
jgi:hypothetical protein